MNDKEYDKLTEDEQRIKVAELCGCTFIDDDPFRKRLTCNRWIDGAKKRHVTVPDYLNDLNACHQFEMAMTDEQMERYDRWLEAIAGEYDCRYATADQRSKAFVLAMTED